jgi:hypothetical protein
MPASATDDLGWDLVGVGRCATKRWIRDDRRGCDGAEPEFEERRRRRRRR